jgi:hypothetical protein
MMALGCAAGAAAGLSVKEGVNPRELDVQLLQKTLVDVLHVQYLFPL